MRNISDKIIKAYNFVLKDNAEISLLSIDESYSIKGILILLVVLGHNKYLMQGGFCNIFLYSFHVYAFFFLPFLYNMKRESFSKVILRNIKRLYIPYTVVFNLLCILAIFQNQSINYLKILPTFLCGTQYMISDLFGFGSFLWFIPTMFSILIVRSIYYYSNISIRTILLVLSIICLTLWAFMIHPSLWFYSPMGFFIAFSMLTPAIICRSLFRWLQPGTLSYLFFTLIIMIMIIYPLRESYQYLCLTISRLICPNLILLFLLSQRQYLSKLQWCKNIGKQSFQIYLIHIFIYNAAYIILDRGINMNLYLGFILYIAVAIASYYLSKIRIMNLLVR